ncbi:MAG: hypothetical protein JST39_05785, partial [Bacteroidetes bacterium]|nr:hypothetical protein [Bacteroidota bacterium]
MAQIPNLTRGPPAISPAFSVLCLPGMPAYLHMGKRFRYIALLLLLCTGSAGLSAQSFPGLQFNHLGTRDGLSSNNATCIAEDRQGFIWIGTDNGLNRYDGYRVKQYFHNDADSNSLVFNAIQSLHCDAKGRLWITTGGGVSCFLPDRNIFINYSVKQGPCRHLKNNTAVLVVEERDGSIWLTNQMEVIYHVQDDMSLAATVIRIPPFSFAGVEKQGYDGILPDSHGREWAFCANRIYLLDPHTRQPLQTFSFAAQLGPASIRNITEDGRGDYWVTTWGEQLWRFNPVDHSILPSTKLPITDIAEWRYNNHP